MLPAAVVVLDLGYCQMLLATKVVVAKMVKVFALLVPMTLFHSAFNFI